MGGCPPGRGWGLFPLPLERAGNLALPGGALFLWRNRGKNTKGKEVPSPWNPILWWEKQGEGGWSDWSLACGLQDQRLMARPPARAGGRSGLLTGGKSGKSKGFSPFSQRAPAHAPSPPSRWTGRYQRSNERAAGQVTSEKYSLPSTTPPERGPGEEPPPLGFFPHFFPRNGAPAGQAKVPARSNGVERNPQRLSAAYPILPGQRPELRQRPLNLLCGHTVGNPHMPRAAKAVPGDQNQVILPGPLTKGRRIGLQGPGKR